MAWSGSFPFSQFGKEAGKMIALKILLGILIFVLFLLCLKLTIRIGYSDKVTVSAGILGIMLQVLPKKKKAIKLKQYSYKNYQKLLDEDQKQKVKEAQNKLKKEDKKKKNAESKKQDKQKKLPPEEATDAPSSIRVIIRIAGKILERFFGILYVKIVRMHITVGGKDAASAALTYAAISQSVSYLMELISCKTRFKRIGKTEITVYPDFLLETVKADICIIFQIRNFYVIKFILN